MLLSIHSSLPKNYAGSHTFSFFINSGQGQINFFGSTKISELTIFFGCRKKRVDDFCWVDENQKVDESFWVDQNYSVNQTLKTDEFFGSTNFMFVNGTLKINGFFKSTKTT